MTAAIDRVIAAAVEASGFRTGSTLENRVAYRLHRWARFTADEVKQQHRVGKYRLDFAWPKLLIALEVDGWHHRSPEAAAKDARRDSWLRGQGWLVFRVDDQSDLDEQLMRVTRVVHALS